MSALSAQEMLDPQVVRVTATMRPADLEEGARGAKFYAVFDDEDRTFLGLVRQHACARFPHRIFADLTPRSAPAPVTPGASFDTIADRMEAEALEALPVTDEQGIFIGVITRPSCLEALLRRERSLLAESQHLREELEAKQQRLVALSKRLEGLNEASRTLLGLVARSPVEQRLLQEGLQALATLVQARYGAIGIMDDAGGHEQFIFTGLTPEEAERIGELPQGRGLLGVVIRENQVLRVADLTQDPRHADFPPHHPPLKSLLAVPLSHQGQVYGRVYLCDKTTGEPFTEDDEQMALSFARSLALAFAHARERAERKRAEGALLATRARLQHLLSASPAVIYSCKPSGEYGATFISENIRSQLGYEPREFIEDSRFWADRIHPEDAPRVLAGLSRLSEQGHHTHEYRFLHKDGTYRWMRDELRLVRDASGNPTEIVGYWIDITERKRAEEALERRVWEQQALLCLSRTLLGLLDPKAIAHASFEAIREHLQPDSVGLRVPDAQGTYLEMIAAEGWMKEEIDHLRVPLEPPELSGAAWAVHARTPVFGDHTSGDRPFAAHELAERTGVKACLHMPMLVEKRVVGVLTINSLIPRAYTDEELRFVTLITNQAGIALDRANKHQKLLESELWFRAIFDSLEEGIFVVTPDRIVVNANSAAQQMLGYTLEELRLQSTERLHVDHEHYVEFGERIWEGFRRGKAGRFEFKLRRKSGEIFPTEHMVSLLKGVAGEPLGIVSVARDITERKQAEEALREMNVALANAMPGISRLDPEGRYVNVNEVYARMLGYEPGELIGTDWALTVYPDDRGNALTAYRRVLSEGKAEFEARAVRKDGSVFHKHVLMVQIVDKDGSFMGHHCFMGDITERREAEETLQALYRASLSIQEPLVLHERLDRLLTTARDVLRLDRLNILLADPEGRWLEGVAALGTKEPAEAMRVPIGPGGGSIAQAYLSQRSVIWPDPEVPVPEEFRLQPPYNRPDAFRSRAFALLPLVVRGRVIGVLGADRKHTRRPLEPALLPLLQLFAAQAAIAIQNARLYQEAERRRQVAESLAEVGRLITHSLDPEEVAQGTVDNVRRLLDVHAATLFRLNPESGDLVTIAISGDVGPALVKNVVLPQGSATVGLAVRERKPVTTSNFLTDPRITLTPELRARLEQLPYRAVLAVPLVVQERVIGALSIGYPAGRVFGQEAIRLVEAFANQAAIALANAQLFTQVQAGRLGLQNLSRRLVEAQEAERRSLARELHDEIGQALTVVKINLQEVRRSAAAVVPGPSVEESIGIVDRLLQQVRDLSLDLRPSILDDLGLLAALRWYVDRHAQRANFIAMFAADPPDIRLPPNTETTCFRVAQEALTNVVRHARARLVHVEVRQLGAELELSIRDDGIGFDVQVALEQAAPAASLGLLGMQERVLLAGGQIEIKSAPTRGTEIRARLPLPPPPDSGLRGNAH